MSQALYRTWRPALWDEVVGQEHIVQTLKNAIVENRVGHAYLFAGPRGTGKTTTARLLAKAVNCLAEDLAARPCNLCANCLAVNEGRFMDLIEIDAASNTSVDDVRDLRDKINFAPSQGRFKVYIIDEVHMLSTSAFNALLKTLEEPPAHVIFILATTEIHKIPATVLSRCQRFEFRRIPVPTIVEKLKVLTEAEKIDIEENALSLIARQATGSMRDAISLVDQLSSMTKVITLPIAQNVLGTATSQAVIDLVDQILDQASGKGLEIIHKALDSGADPRQFARQVVDYLRNLLVIKLQAGKDLELTPETRKVMNKHAEAFFPLQLVQTITGFSEAATDVKANWHPGLGLELAYAGAISWSPAPVVTPQAAVDTQSVSTPTRAPKAVEKTAVSIPGSKPIGTPVEITPLVPGAPLSYDVVQAHWDTIKKAVRAENPVSGALLNSSRLADAQNDAIVLNFSSDLLRDRMMDEKTQRPVRKVLNKLFGREVQIACTVGQSFAPTEEAGEIAPNGMADMAVRELNGHVRKTEKKKKE